MECIDNDKKNDNVKKNVEVNISVVDTGEIDHFVWGLIIENENDVAHEDESEEVAHDDTYFLGVVESCKWKVETQNCESKEHLIDQDEIRDEICSIDLKREYFEGIVVILPELVLFFDQRGIILVLFQSGFFIFNLSSLTLVTSFVIFLLFFIFLILLVEKIIKLTFFPSDSEMMNQEP